MSDNKTIQMCSTKKNNIPKESILISDGLLAYYPCDGNTLDKSNNKNHGTWMGGEENYASGIDGSSFYIDGTSQVDIPFIPTPSENGISFSMWIKVPESSSVRSILDSDATVNIQNGFQIRFETDGRIRFGSSLGNTAMGTNFGLFSQWALRLDTDDWVHIVCTWTGNTSASGVKIYVNGNVSTSTTASYNYDQVSYNREMVIGNIAWASSNQPLNGAIDEINIFNRELTQSEINILYNEIKNYKKIGYINSTTQESFAELDDDMGFDYFVTTIRPEIPANSTGTPIQINLGDIGGATDILVRDNVPSLENFLLSNSDRSFISGLGNGSTIPIGLDKMSINGKTIGTQLVRVRSDYLKCQRYNDIAPGSSQHNLYSDIAEPTNQKISPFNGWPFTYENIVDPIPENRHKGIMGSYGSNNFIPRTLFVSSNSNFPSGQGLYIQSMWTTLDGTDTILNVAYVNSRNNPVPSESVNVVIIVVS